MSYLDPSSIEQAIPIATSLSAEHASATHEVTQFSELIFIVYMFSMIVINVLGLVLHSSRSESSPV